MKTIEFLVRFTAQVPNNVSTDSIEQAFLLAIDLPNLKSTIDGARFVEYETMEVVDISN